MSIESIVVAVGVLLFLAGALMIGGGLRLISFSGSPRPGATLFRVGLLLVGAGIVYLVTIALSGALS